MTLDDTWLLLGRAVSWWRSIEYEDPELGWVEYARTKSEAAAKHVLDEMRAEPRAPQHWRVTTHVLTIKVEAW